VEEVLGYPAATNTIWELEKARCILVVNSNITEEQNVVGVPIKRAVKGGASLVVIDPREVELTRYAQLWLRPRPGSELALVGGILRAVFDGAYVDPMVNQRSGLEELLRSLQAFDLERVSRVTGVPVEGIQEAARLYGANKPSAILYALDNVSPEHHRECSRVIACLALATGNFGKPSVGIYPLRQGTNEQGAWDMGCVPHLLPGYRSVADEGARRHLEDTWGAPIPASLGMGVGEIFNAAAAGKIRAIHILGDDVNFSNGMLGDVERALSTVDFLMVQDTFLSPVAQRAHLVLPASTFAEKEGT